MVGENVANFSSFGGRAMQVMQVFFGGAAGDVQVFGKSRCCHGRECVWESVA